MKIETIFTENSYLIQVQDLDQSISTVARIRARETTIDIAYNIVAAQVGNDQQIDICFDGSTFEIELFRRDERFDSTQSVQGG